MGFTMARCKGITRAGHRCTCDAKEGDYCGHHQPKPVEPTPPPIDHGLRFEFIDIALEIREELRSLDVPVTSRPAYWNLIVSCIKNAKEEQRLLDGHGAGVQYVAITTPPTDKPKPPDIDPSAQSSDEPEPEDDKRVLN